jgi:hypothetical protein
VKAIALEKGKRDNHIGMLRDQLSSGARDAIAFSQLRSPSDR